MKLNKLIIWIWIVLIQNSFAGNKPLDFKDSLKNTIQGKLIDAYSKRPLSPAWVSIKGSKVKVTTDSVGKFKLIAPRRIFKSKITLVVLCRDYEAILISINKKDLPLNKDFSLVLRELHAADRKPPIEKKKK